MALKDIAKSINHFCSQSCSATYNNKNRTHGTRRSKLEIFLEKELTNIYTNLDIKFNSKENIGSELDIFIPSLKLAFEINGIFHYEPIYGQEKLNHIKANDIDKKRECRAKAIKLIIIRDREERFNPSGALKYLNRIRPIIDKNMG